MKLQQQLFFLNQVGHLELLQQVHNPHKFRSTSYYHLNNLLIKLQPLQDVDQK